MSDYEAPAAVSDRAQPTAPDKGQPATDLSDPPTDPPVNEPVDADAPTGNAESAVPTGDTESTVPTGDTESTAPAGDAESTAPAGTDGMPTGVPIRSTATLDDVTPEDMTPEGMTPADGPDAAPIWSAAATADEAGSLARSTPMTDDTDSPTPAASDGNDSQPAPVDRRSGPLRPRNLVLAGVAVAVIALAAALGRITWQLWDQKDVRIVTPPRVAGLVLDDSQGAHDTIDYLRTAVETGVSLKKSTGAVYADEAGRSRSVLFIGGTGVLVSPEESLGKTFGLIADDAGGVDDVHVVSAGSLGGVMKCGSTKTDGSSMAVCGWADHGSLGIAMFPNRPVDESAELLRTMRQSMQNRR
jgi:hypothetical protein